MEKQVLLYYKFIPIPQPNKEVSSHKEIAAKIGLTGRVLIGPEGINGTIEGTRSQLQQYTAYLDSHPLFSGMVFKSSLSDGHAFKKLKVKSRDEIVTLGKQVDLRKTGKRISPEELHRVLENQEDVVLVDMRNEYESRIGKFRDSVVVKTENFRDLPGEIKSLENLKNKKVITYCTGGIRCEKASALLVEQGFKDVSQLEGGIFKYGEKYPDGFFEGKCFVFDQRMSVSFSEKAKTIAKCEHCNSPEDRYLDCANLSCHRLTICCQSCEQKFGGLCPLDIQTAAGVKTIEVGLLT